MNKTLLIDWFFFNIEGHVSLDINPGWGCNTLLLRLIPGDLYRQFHTLLSLLHSQAAMPNPYTNACMPSREAVCTIFMMALGLTCGCIMYDIIHSEKQWLGWCTSKDFLGGVCSVHQFPYTRQNNVVLEAPDNDNEEQIITGYSIDAPWAVWVEDGFGSYRWFVYITTLLLREASWLLYCIVGHLNPSSAPSILLVLLEPH